MTTDPRRPGGGIAGPGGPFDRNSVVIDPRDAVLLSECEVSLVEGVSFKNGSTGPVVAMSLSGRINKTTENASILFLFGLDGAGDIMAQLFGLAARAGPEIADQLEAEFKRAFDEQPGFDDD